MSYDSYYSRVLRYTAGHDDVATTSKRLTNNELAGSKHTVGDKPDWTRRLALADAIQDVHGDNELSEHLRNLEQPIHRDEHGNLQKGVAKYRDVVFHSNDVSAQDHFDHIHEHGPESTLEQMLHDNDSGTGVMYDNPAHGNQDQVHQEGDHIMSWNQDYPYIGVQERHILPETDATINHRGERGDTYSPRHDLK